MATSNAEKRLQAKTAQRDKKNRPAMKVSGNRTKQLRSIITGKKKTSRTAN